MPSCPNCGKEVSEDTKFCPECGQRIVGDEPSVATGFGGEAKKGFTPEERQKYIEELKTSVEGEQPAKKTKMKKKLLIGLGAVVGIFVIIGIIAIATGPVEEPARTAPEKSTLTPSEQAYATTFVDQTATLSKALIELGALLQNPEIGNDEWTIQVAIQLAIIRLTYDEAMELDPPSSMAEIHLKYTQAMKHFNDSTYLLTQGIDELDPNLMEEATTEVETAEQLLNEVTELILEFKETHK